MIVRGEGCYVYDEHGKRYLDGLSALYCVNIGHGRAELGEAAARAGRRSSASTRTGATPTRARSSWPRASPSSRPGTSTACSSPPAARRRSSRRGSSPRPTTPRAASPRRHKLDLAQARLPRHLDGRADGDRPAAAARAVRAAHARRATTCPTPTPTAGARTAIRCGRPTRSRRRSCSRVPSTVAAVILEPVQNGGGCFVPQDGYFQRVREICDRHGVLLISDEVICSWGRLGHWFGCERFGYQPDMITTAKGITSAYAPLGAVIAGDHIAEPFLHGNAIFNHGFTFGGHPIACAVGAGEHRRDRARGSVRARARQRGAVPGDARGPARPADRRRRARRRLLPGDRAGQGQGDQGDVRRTRSPRSCCAASSRASCTGAG